jgi:hypothetical protein
VYDWTIVNSFFSAGKEKEPEFIQGFSSASIEHFHSEERESD